MALTDKPTVPREELWNQQHEAEIKAHILCKKHGLERPIPEDYDDPYRFIKDDARYRKRWNYYYTEILNGRMQVL